MLYYYIQPDPFCQHLFSKKFTFFVLHENTPADALLHTGGGVFHHQRKLCGKLFLIGRHHDLQAAHVGLQDLGDGNAAVGLQVVLQECDQHTRRCHAGVVQGVGQIGLAVLALDADCLLYTSPSPRDLSTSRMPSSA